MHIKYNKINNGAKRRPNRNDLDDLHSCRLTQTWVTGKHTKIRSVLLDLFNLNNHSTDVSYILRLPTKMYIKYKKIEANLLVENTLESEKHNMATSCYKTKTSNKNKISTQNE